jgi:hypothetical protein
MSKALRFVGLINAAVWLGSAVFVTVGLPVLFSPELGRYIQRPYVGLAAESLLARYCVVQYWCAAIALAHLVADYFFAGHRIARATLLIWLGLTSFALANGLWLQPKMRDLHQTKYWGTVPAAKENADRTFKALHGSSQAANLLVMSVLVIYLWRVSRPLDGDGKPRSATLTKFRS